MRALPIGLRCLAVTAGIAAVALAAPLAAAASAPEAAAPSATAPPARPTVPGSVLTATPVPAPTLPSVTQIDLGTTSLPQPVGTAAPTIAAPSSLLVVTPSQVLDAVPTAVPAGSGGAGGSTGSAQTLATVGAGAAGLALVGLGGRGVLRRRPRGL